MSAAKLTHMRQKQHVAAPVIAALEEAWAVIQPCVRNVSYRRLRAREVKRVIESATGRLAG